MIQLQCKILKVIREDHLAYTALIGDQQLIQLLLHLSFNQALLSLQKRIRNFFKEWLQLYERIILDIWLLLNLYIILVYLLLFCCNGSLQLILPTPQTIQFFRVFIIVVYYGVVDLLKSFLKCSAL